MWWRLSRWPLLAPMETLTEEAVCMANVPVAFGDDARLWQECWVSRAPRRGAAAQCATRNDIAVTSRSKSRTEATGVSTLFVNHTLATLS